MKLLTLGIANKFVLLSLNRNFRCLVEIRSLSLSKARAVIELVDVLLTDREKMPSPQRKAKTVTELVEVPSFGLCRGAAKDIKGSEVVFSRLFIDAMNRINAGHFDKLSDRIDYAIQRFRDLTISRQATIKTHDNKKVTECLVD